MEKEEHIPYLGSHLPMKTKEYPEGVAQFPCDNAAFGKKNTWRSRTLTQHKDHGPPGSNE